jgi:methyl-accepting chemotaxis protein
MKRQLSLGVNLTLRIGAVLLLVVASLVALFVWFTGQLQNRLFEAVEAGALANARVVAADVGYDLFTGEAANVLQKIEGFRKSLDAKAGVRGAASKDGGSSRIAIVTFDVDGAPMSKTAGASVEALFPGGFKNALKTMFPRAGGVSKGATQIVGNMIVATVSAKAEQNDAGYVVFAESVAEYLAFRTRLFVLMAVGLFAGLVFVGVGAVIVGRRAAAPINRIASTAQQMAAGELRHIDLQRENILETDNLSTSVSRMAEALRSQVISTKQLASEASLMSREVASAMAHLATSAAQQAAAVSETASTVEEMEKAGKSVGENARQIVDAAEKTTEASIRGRKAVDTTSEIILKIKEDSQEISAKSKTLLTNVEEIGNIIASVNAIAEQSKILAVNASIEAAKAGEYGAGFAVVAQEVKDLAQQSKEATEQITKTLTGIRHAIEQMVSYAAAGERRTDDGVKMVANAGAIVNDLSEAIRENSDLANGIFTAITQQTLGLTQIAAAIEEINSSAAENQNISRKIEQSTRHMSDSLGNLSALVGKWKTSDEDGA